MKILLLILIILLVVLYFIFDPSIDFTEDYILLWYNRYGNKQNRNYIKLKR